MSGYQDRLNNLIQRRGTPVLVGIDPRWDLLPDAIRGQAEASSGDLHQRMAFGFEAFSKELIDIVSRLVPAIKPQVAFFEQLGVPGMQALQSVMKYARRAGLIVIADAKRGDIGSTAEAYADAWLAGEDPDAAAWSADAVTVNPYLGADTLVPFLQVAVRRNAGVYVLVRTSNPGAADFQDRVTDNNPLYTAVADRVQELSHSACGVDDLFGPLGAVVGATWPTQLRELRTRMPSVPFLIPGYGSQGGTAQDTAGAFRDDGLGAIVNNSRGINFAWTQKPWKERFSPDEWEQAVEAATREMIRDLADNTPAGSLRTNG